MFLATIDLDIRLCHDIIVFMWLPTLQSVYPFSTSHCWYSVWQTAKSHQKREKAKSHSQLWHNQWTGAWNGWYE